MGNCCSSETNDPIVKLEKLMEMQLQQILQQLQHLHEQQQQQFQRHHEQQQQQLQRHHEQQQQQFQQFQQQTTAILRELRSLRNEPAAPQLQIGMQNTTATITPSPDPVKPLQKSTAAATLALNSESLARNQAFHELLWSQKYDFAEQILINGGKRRSPSKSIREKFEKKFIVDYVDASGKTNQTLRCALCGWYVDASLDGENPPHLRNFLDKNGQSIEIEYPSANARKHAVSMAHLLKRPSECNELKVPWDESNFIPLCGTKTEKYSCHHAFDHFLLSLTKVKKQDGGDDDDAWRINTSVPPYLQLLNGRIVRLQNKPHRRVLHAHAYHCAKNGFVSCGGKFPELYSPLVEYLREASCSLDFATIPEARASLPSASATSQASCSEEASSKKAPSSKAASSSFVISSEPTAPSKLQAKTDSTLKNTTMINTKQDDDDQ